MKNTHNCPLCLSPVSTILHLKKPIRHYFDCSHCGLISLAPELLLNHQKEKERYLEHNNSSTDKRYQAFLADIIDTVKKLLPPSSVGLDYGSGPHPVMSELLKLEQYSVQSYDPYFAEDPTLLKHTYDFITCCEVVEHFNTPCEDFLVLNRTLKEGAPLIIKSAIYDDQTSFDRWYYVQDPTHVSLYRKETFDWIKNRYSYSFVEWINKRVVILWK